MSTLVPQFLRDNVTVIVALLAFGAGVWLAYRAAQFIRAFRMRRLRARGAAGEVRAREWLEARGFEILETQVRRTGVMEVDGEEVEFVVKADFLVRREDRVAIVEVKTGAAADAANRMTRRQLLEYQVVYATEEVFLFDATREQLVSVRFAGGHLPAHGWERSGLRVTHLAIALAVGAVLGAILGVLYSR